MSRFTLSKAFERSIEWRMREVFESSRSISIRRVMESRAPSCGLPAFCRWWGTLLVRRMGDDLPSRKVSYSFRRQQARVMGR